MPEIYFGQMCRKIIFYLFHGHNVSRPGVQSEFPAENTGRVTIPKFTKNCRMGTQAPEAKLLLVGGSML